MYRPPPIRFLYIKHCIRGPIRLNDYYLHPNVSQYDVLTTRFFLYVSIIAPHPLGFKCTLLAPRFALCVHHWRLPPFSFICSLLAPQSTLYVLFKGNTTPRFYIFPLSVRLFCSTYSLSPICRFMEFICQPPYFSNLCFIVAPVRLNGRSEFTTSDPLQMSKQIFYNS